LILVYLHLPDYREKNSHPLDVVAIAGGLIVAYLHWRIIFFLGRSYAGTQGSDQGII